MGIDLLVFLFSLVIMFIPTIVAFSRNLKRRWACFWFDLLFGWTIFVWVFLVAWSMLSSAVEDKPTA